MAAEVNFGDAVALRRSGDLAAADGICARLLQENPRHADARHLRGLIALQRGDTARGIALLQEALQQNPDQPLAQSNLGNALLSVGQPLAALECLDNAVRLDATLAVAHLNRGLALQRLDRPNEALDSLSRASALDPRSAAALRIRGNILMSLGRLRDAVHDYSGALRLEPCSVEALLNRCAALQRLNRLDEALEDCERALHAMPDSPVALRSTGNVLLGLKRFDAACECFRQACALAPDDVAAWYGRAAASVLLGRLEDAAHGFEEVLRRQPGHEFALGNLFQLRRECCDWHDHAELSARTLVAMRTSKRFVNPIVPLLFDDPQLSLECAQAYSEPDVAESCPATVAVAHRAGKIRIAYVSADFGDHPVAHLLVGVLERHDRERFEILGVSLRERPPSAFAQRLQRAFDRVIDVSAVADRDGADLLRRSCVDVAVDLMGLTEGARFGIFAARAAPVQVGYLGYAGTVGAGAMDYLIADSVVVPPGCERWYRERVVRLPDCFLPTDDRAAEAPSTSRQAHGLPRQGSVLCAFTKVQKLAPDVFSLWLRLLRQVDGSILWLRDMGTVANANLARFAAANGIDPKRLIFAPRVPGRAEHLSRIALADLFLDTVPYNAHSTACDALSAGVPVVTSAGKSFASRVAASALAAAGLPDYITDSLAGYERRALELLQEPRKLEEGRARLIASRRSAPLFDTARYTRTLESAYAQMHERVLRGEGPVGFTFDAAVRA